MDVQHKILGNKAIFRVKHHLCETPDELLNSDLFYTVVKRGLKQLEAKQSRLVSILGEKPIDDSTIITFISTLQFLIKMPSHLVPNVVPDANLFLADKAIFSELVEYLYNYWRSFDRFMICDSEGDALDKRPYRTFNDTIERLTHLIRQVYRDIEENITGSHPRIYRQVAAGAEVSAIALPLPTPFEHPLFSPLNMIPVISQILLYPPMVLNTPSNKRTGKFKQIDQNPLSLFSPQKDEWICYPAKVGTLLIYIYFHQQFFELGFSLANLFELADRSELDRKPDAVYLYGVPGNVLDNLGTPPTVFYEEPEQELFIAAVPGHSEFGYFGYLKKMVLTLHNIIMIKRGILPFHGALIKIILKGNRSFVILLMGDTGAGKSETLEAFRTLAADQIQDIIIIADDMGSLQIDEKGTIIGYGTETGAFLRLDDLQSGFAFGQIDRTIIMNPSQVNARIIIPVTTYSIVCEGFPVDFILYANNYEEIDDDHPIIERILTVDQSLRIFREGTVMSKGTTTTTGLVHTYFANIFGPVQYRSEHETLAVQFFERFFQNDLFVGQMRTRLGIPGKESDGPQEAARELLNELIRRS